jgi:hypothetical protein
LIPLDETFTKNNNYLHAKTYRLKACKEILGVIFLAWFDGYRPGGEPLLVLNLFIGTSDFIFTGCYFGRLHILDVKNPGAVGDNSPIYFT